MRAPAITLQNACLRYREQILFQNLTLHLAAGRTTCLLGPSGVGKTSLLRMLAALPVAHDTTQSFTLSADDQLPLHNRIAYLAQADLLLPWLTCLENTLLGYRLRKAKTSAAYRRAQQLLTQVGLNDAADKYPAELSGGMRQRIALVRTLLEDQPIVLMDEPFSALDSITRLQLQNLTTEFLQDKTVLLITHDPLEALRMGHQIIVLAGCPARLLKTIDLDLAFPRALTDAKLLQLQGELMQYLAQAKEMST